MHTRVCIYTRGGSGIVFELFIEEKDIFSWFAIPLGCWIGHKGRLSWCIWNGTQMRIHLGHTCVSSVTQLHHTSHYSTTQHPRSKGIVAIKTTAPNEKPPSQSWKWFPRPISDKQDKQTRSHFPWVWQWDWSFTSCFKLYENYTIQK